MTYFVRTYVRPTQLCTSKHLKEERDIHCHTFSAHFSLFKISSHQRTTNFSMMDEHLSSTAAAAYPWGIEEHQLSPSDTRKRRGSGYAVVEQALKDSSTSNRAKEILRNLVDMNDFAEETTDDSSLLATTALTKQSSSSPLVAINPNAPFPEEEILQMAQDGQISLLGSIVRVIQESIVTPVSTKDVLKSCVLGVCPGSIPAYMDAKDMVVAALLFLSSTHKNEYWDLPLIRPIDDTIDLEKRTYELVQSPTESQIQWLEAAFVSSADKYVAREKFCPRLEPNDEAPLLFKGIIPAVAMPQTAAAKRKATLAAKAAAAAASPTPPPDGMP